MFFPRIIYWPVLEVFPPASDVGLPNCFRGRLELNEMCKARFNRVLNLTYEPSTVLSNVSLMVPRAEWYVVQR